MSQDFRRVGDSAVGTTSSAVVNSAVGTPSFLIGDSAAGTTSSAVVDSAVGTPSFPATPCSNVGLVGNVLLLLLSARYPFAASKYDFNFYETVVTKLSVTCYVS